MPKDFEGKICVVTGGASGIGLATALELMNRGASIALIDKDQIGLTAAQKSIEEVGGDVLILPTDVTDAVQLEEAFLLTIKKYSQIDLVVNSAGIAGHPNDGCTADLNLERWHSIIDVNLNGSFYAAKYALKHMLETEGGVIVFVSSVMGDMAASGIGAYTASKHAVVGLAKTIAAEYGSRNIRSLAIAPGYILTPMTACLGPTEDLPVKSTPLGRPGKPEEVAKFIAMLASDDASYVTGGFYPVDGGFLATK